MRNGHWSGLWEVLVKFCFTLGFLSAGALSLSAQPAAGELAIAQHYAAGERIPMAEKIGATIQIASQPGKGTCVTILFATAAGG